MKAESEKRKIIFIVGPTASGKTALSIELAKKMRNAGVRTEIVSADSRQIFKDLNLSTGKVAPNEMEGFPHHMLDVVNPSEYFSVVDFVHMSLKKIEEIYDRGSVPIIVGGTGFYIDSILYNYNLPEVRKDDELRHRLSNMSNEEIFKYFTDKYPEVSKTIESNHELKNNKHRLMRFVEVVTSLGYFPPLEKLPRFDPEKYDVEIVKTALNLDTLRPKIHKRLIERLEAGMVEEIKSVKEKYGLSFEYLEKLGLEFKWVSRYLKNEVSYEDMIKRLSLEIGQYAKRQIAWFKRY